MLPCPNPLPPPLPLEQYLAELEEKERAGGAASLPFGKPLAPVGAKDLGFAGARLDLLVGPPCCRCRFGARGVPHLLGPRSLLVAQGRVG
jgi:hypothetical protein